MLTLLIKVFKPEFVGNKVKVQISKKQVLQENKARQIFRQANISYTLIRTRGVRNDRFSENLVSYVFL